MDEPEPPEPDLVPEPPWTAGACWRPDEVYEDPVPLEPPMD